MAAANGAHDLGLAPDDPSLRIAGRQIRDRQGTSIRADHIFDPPTHLFGHFTLTQNLT
jgi:hypothetical protein